VALLSFDKTKNLITLNVPRIRLKYGMDEFVRSFITNDDEDGANSVRVTSPYAQIAWVNIAVTVLARHVCRAEFEIYQGDTKVESGPTWKLFRDVNSEMSKSQLWEATTSWLYTRGECFWLSPDDETIPTEWFIPDPGSMVESVDKNGKITLWHYVVDNRKIPFLPAELIHFKLWNPWNWRRGVNPLRALDAELDMDLNASQANLGMLRNTAVPEGLLTTDNPMLSEDQARDIKERWSKDHGGSRKRHSVSVLGNGVKYQQIQMSPADMEYFRMKRWTRETILAKYGIPLVIAGAVDDRTPLSGQDTDHQMKNFWESTIIPILNFYQDKLETEFFARHKIKLIGRFNVDGISELQDDKTEQYTRQLADVSAGVRTINEIREERGLDPVPWGETWWTPMALVPYGEEQPERELMDHAEWFKESVDVDTLMGKSMWPMEYKERHWRRTTKTWARVESLYRKDTQDFIFGIRSRVLELLTRTKGASDMFDEIMDEAYWVTKEREFTTLTNARLREAIAATEPHIREVLTAAGIKLELSWSIFNTAAVQMLDRRLDKIGDIIETIREDVRLTLKGAIEDGITDAEAASEIGKVFNVAKGRANTIARTEIGGAVNDADIAAYLDVGFLYHSWLPTFDAEVRDSHRIGMDGNAGETVAIGEPFSNGLLYPHDPAGPADQTINCRCLTLPEKTRGET